jgi:hypothetical protein
MGFKGLMVAYIDTKSLTAVEKTWNFLLFTGYLQMEGLLLIYIDMKSQFNFINLNIVYLRENLWP